MYSFHSYYCPPGKSLKGSFGKYGSETISVHLDKTNLAGLNTHTHVHIRCVTAAKIQTHNLPLIFVVLYNDNTEPKF